MSDFDVPPHPRGYWRDLSDDDLRRAIDEYRAIGHPVLDDTAADMEDDLARRAAEREAVR